MIAAALLAACVSAGAADFALDTGIPVGEIYGFRASEAAYDLATGAWTVEAVPLVTNRLASSLDSVVLPSTRIDVRRVVVTVERAEVLAAMGVSNLTNVPVLDFQSTVVGLAVGKIEQALRPAE
jgi:hypothetical protein